MITQLLLYGNKSQIDLIKHGYVLEDNFFEGDAAALLDETLPIIINSKADVSNPKINVNAIISKAIEKCVKRVKKEYRWYGLILALYQHFEDGEQFNITLKEIIKEYDNWHFYINPPRMEGLRNFSYSPIEIILSQLEQYKKLTDAIEVQLDQIKKECIITNWYEKASLSILIEQLAQYNSDNIAIAYVETEKQKEKEPEPENVSLNNIELKKKDAHISPQVEQDLTSKNSVQSSQSSPALETLPSDDNVEHNENIIMSLFNYICMKIVSFFSSILSFF